MRLLGGPAGLALALLATSFTPRVAGNDVLVGSFWAAGAVLLAWVSFLVITRRRDTTARTLEVVLRPQHYLQATVQLSVVLYWGYFWRPVYDHAWLLVAQLLFAYAFDMLLTWSRRPRYVLGFGPFPIILSTNLFLWFRDDWFYLQFLMLAAGFLGKALIQWQREGRRTHIFNPSAFSLGLFSLLLIATGTTELTWGQDIASTLTLAPRIYLFLFLLGLVVMYVFSITLVAGSAAIVLFGLSALYSGATGVPYFIDSEIPSAVFLGLHLLVTDPSTSPRTPIGKLLFGTLYGVGVFALYALLSVVGVPTFYDKLLCVPLLNLSVERLDRVARRLRHGGGLPLPGQTGPDWTPGRANLVHIGAWVLFFGLMTAVGSTDGRHRGDTIPFWQHACAEDRPLACQRLIQIETNYCSDNAGWACNELGRHLAGSDVIAADPERARDYFRHACELRFQAGCLNLLVMGSPDRPAPPDETTLLQANPRPLDLRLLLREAGPNLVDMPEPALYARACDHGWSFAC
ncbi:MAG: hypothetical protein O3A25_02505 [Acidobacteria bacterium]|nr:hypothetical protein [Acidobacteriota bacterium]